MLAGLALHEQEQLWAAVANRRVPARHVHVARAVPFPEVLVPLTVPPLVLISEVGAACPAREEQHMLTACGIADPLLSVSTEADPMEIGSSIALSDFEASNDSFDPRRQRSRNRRSSRSKHRH